MRTLFAALAMVLCLPAMAETDQEFYAANFPVAVDKAIAKGGLDGFSGTIGACAEVFNAGQLRDACAKDFMPAYRAKVARAGFTPRSCQQWAIKHGQQWEDAEQDMQYAPLASSRAPVKFSGRVIDAGEGTLLVFDGVSSSAVIQVSQASSIYAAGSIKVGAVVNGYGRKTDKTQATLTNGQKTVIPVIYAECLSGSL